MKEKPLYKSKTFWAGISGLAAAIGGYATGSLTLAAAVQAGITALIGIFLRDAVRN